MPHILRDVTGRIIAVLDRPSAGPSQEIAAGDPELLAFLGSSPRAAGEARARLARADLDFIRVLDDLIVALLTRNVIALHDLPREAYRKLLERRALRERVASEEPLLSEDTDLIP